MSQYRALPPHDINQRWLVLEAAHVVGQTHFGPHWRVHVAMLLLAWRTADRKEILGQAMRLALVPVGHAVHRLPLGNPGRANVSAFAPMPVRSDIAQVIARAQDKS
ncbi:MAG: DUF3703 domain-containing protein [Acidovorax sp.]|nr:DUF3703 domain-containing protein [Acidovorax sp.]MCI5069066.1 DUF3703 domain-containing protein [Acidovorax sp.]